MIVTIMVETEDYKHQVSCRIDSVVLEHPFSKDEAKQQLYHAYHIAKTNLEKRLAFKE